LPINKKAPQMQGFESI